MTCGTRQVTAFDLIERIADALTLPDHARVQLGLAPRNWPTSSGGNSVSPLTVVGEVTAEDEESVRRRSFIGLTGVTVLGAVFPPVEAGRPAGEEFTAGLLRYRWLREATDTAGLPDLRTLRQAVDAAKRAYQACQYTEVAGGLPALLAALDDAAGAVEGDDRLAVEGLAAEAYHVAASIQLKLGNEGPVWIAADRSMRAAERSENPVMIASSARILTHALMDGRHFTQAKTFAAKTAAKLATSWSTADADALSVYGALVLRGSIAAARYDDRAGALELVEEAAEAGKRLGVDANHMWTGFGPTNVQLHQVNIALALGDAGAAIEHARRVDLSRIPLTERRACLFVDVAHAYAQWGKYDQAYRALRAAEETAPEELTGRPTVRRLVRETCENAPPTTRREARELAQRVGVA